VVKLKSIKVDEDTYRLLLKLKYEHAMRGVKLTFGDLVKGLLLGVCHASKEKKVLNSGNEDIKEKKKQEKTSHVSST